MENRPVTKAVLLYIEENLSEELSLEKIAREFSYSPFYMARAFKDDMGITLYKYIQGRRLDDAAGKLAETNRPIVEIALEAGYGSQQAFAQAFRCKYGCAPREYRRKGVFASRPGGICMRMRMTEGRMAA